MKCTIHLAGNHPCRAEAVYRVEWDINEPRAYSTEPPAYRTAIRPVCPAHLEAAINGALDGAPSGLPARVSMEPM